MDLVASCKDKLAYFRIKELRDVLSQFGLSKQGKKQDLVERILGALSDDPVAKMWAKRTPMRKEDMDKLVDDIYRKMQVSGAAELASKGQVVSDNNNVKIKGEMDDLLQSEVKIRCPCGSSLETENIIKCEDPRCQVGQHIGCVIIPEKPTEGNLPVPDIFYCEICRLSRADPFWLAIAHPLYPVKLAVTNIPTDGTNPMQNVYKTFHITRAEKDLLTKQEYDVQAWCMLLNDKVPFRMQWPQYADLQVNGEPIRAINRPGSQLLGANGRDDGPIITSYTKAGINKITLTGCDARIFCFGVRIVKRRTVQQILNMIPKETDGECFGDAHARVCRCVGGGAATDNADSDSDLEVVADFFGVNLRCPMSGSRVKVAGRFKPCIHMGCFDLEVFVELNQRSRKWQCPICLKNYSLENVIIDPYFNCITSKMRNCGEDITEIEVMPDGSWRAQAKTENERRELGDLAQWHFPDGTLCGSGSAEVKPRIETLKQIKLEGTSEFHTVLKLGIGKNLNGFWEVSKPEDMNTTSGSRLQERFEHPEPKIIPMSSSATGSDKDGEDASVNQDGGGTYDFTSNGTELDSMPLNIDSTYEFTDQNLSAPAGNAEIIVLSDSDEENEILISSATYKDNQNDAGGLNFPVALPGISHPYSEDQNLSAPAGNAEVIVLSDSDEENEILISSATYKDNQNYAGGLNFPVASPGISHPYSEDQNLSAPAGNAEVIVLSDSDEENEILISSATYKDNQNDAGGLNFPVALLGISHPYSEDQNLSAPAGNAEVIVLSDSDEENEILISSATYKDNQNDAGGLNFPVAPPGISHPYSEDPSLAPVGNLDLFNPNDEFDVPLWPLPPGTQEGSGFQLFNTDVSDALICSRILSIAH